MNKHVDIVKIPSVFVEILKKRDIEGREKISEFLYPKLSDLPNPETMKGMKDAVDLVIKYWLADQPIVVWGDYDVDGTTGTSLLVNFFRKIGKEIHWHIPNRIGEGYGLNIDWFQREGKFNNGGNFLLITVDCGISDFDAIEHIKTMGGSVIVTDHHNLPETSLPDCVILNPSQKSCGFHGTYLAGVGVAFYLAAGIRSRIFSDISLSEKTGSINLKQFLAFVSLGTIADVVQLSSTNRILVRGGFEVLEQSEFPGIKALLYSCEIKDGKVNTEDIGFLIGPLINAAGRVGDSKTVVQLLTSTDEVEAGKLVKKLIQLNKKRKLLCTEGFEEILENIDEARVAEDRSIVVKGNIHQGVAGIIASRLVDLFRVPAIVFAKKNGKSGEKLLVGSARSLDGISIIRAISGCRDLLVKFGGHDMAAGAMLREDRLSEFKNRITLLLIEITDNMDIAPTNKNNFSCSVDNLMSEEYLQFLHLLEPFGPGNDSPVFIDKNTKIINSKLVGKGSEHLQVAIRGKYTNYKGIGFGLGKCRDNVQENPERNMVYSLTKNRFRGTTSWQVRIIDI